MTVHKLLFGDGAATYLPFALSRLRALKALNPEGFFSQTFIVDDTTIHVRQTGKQQYITITAGGGFTFEFAASGKPISLLPTGIPTFPNYYNTVNVATTVTALDGNIVTKPFIRGNKRDNNASVVGYVPQVQMFNQSVRYRQLDSKLRAKYYYPDILYSSYSPPNSFSGAGKRDTFLRDGAFLFTLENILPIGSQSRDIFYDEVWTYTHKFQKPPTSGTLVTSADWPREGGYQTVVDPEFGSRDFAITVDAYGRFHVHPVSSIGPIAGTGVQNVTEADIQHISPVTPAWMYIPTQMAKDAVAADTFDHWLMSQPDYDWKFNPTGTRACAVVLSRSPYTNDAAYWASLANPDTPWTQTKFDTTLRTMLNSGSASGFLESDGTFLPQHYFNGLGLVEATIKITLTGPLPNQYTTEITVAEVRNPNTSQYAALFAGYVWKDITAVGVSAGDLVCVDVEVYSETPAIPRDTHWELIMSVKNLTQGTEAFTTRAYQIVAVDLSTLSMVLKLNILKEDALVPTPLRAGGSVNINWCVNKFAMWVIHSGQSKELMFPQTMPQVWRDELTAAATMTGRARINGLIAGDPTWALTPLASPYDGWTDAGAIAYREFWSYQPHYWYNEVWTLSDPDIFFHGSSYPTGGYVVYRDAPGGYSAPGGLQATQQILFYRYSPPLGTSEHLVFCDNPRWGWNLYNGVMAFYSAVSPTTTFYTHPNGSFCLYCDMFIFNAQGMPNWGVDSSTAADVPYTDSLAIFDATQFEHCIFDRVHLEVKKALGTSASVGTTFMELYNRAVQKGLDDNALEEGIKLMSLADIRGTFEKTVTHGTDIQGYAVDYLELKFTWRGKEWYFFEPGFRGAYTAGEPSINFGPQLCGGLLGLSLGQAWTQAPAPAVTGYPAFVDMTNPTALPIRFCNPLIIMG